MNKNYLFAIIAVVVVVAVGSYALTAKKSDTTTPTPTPTPSASATATASASASTDTTSPVNVTISGYAFAPTSITIKKGTTVTWTNQDSVKHTVTTTSGNGGPSSDLFGKGETFSYTFNDAGTYAYKCTPHPYMTGTVTVTE